MKTQEEIHKFVQLRAQGLSFDKIAKKLKISKPTLIKWSKKYALEIANLRAERLEALREEYCLSVEAKVRMWGQIVNHIIDQIERRSLRNVTTDKLLDMLIKAQKKLEQSYIEPVFISDDDIEEYRQLNSAQDFSKSLIASLQKQDIPGFSASIGK
jgi:transcriptional regulator with XRE-family HTH domain